METINEYISVSNPYGLKDYYYNSIDTNIDNSIDNGIDNSIDSAYTSINKNLEFNIRVINSIREIQQVLGNISDYRNGFYNFSLPVLQTISEIKQEINEIKSIDNNQDEELIKLNDIDNIEKNENTKKSKLSDIKSLSIFKSRKIEIEKKANYSDENKDSFQNKLKQLFSQENKKIDNENKISSDFKLSSRIMDELDNKNESTLNIDELKNTKNDDKPSINIELKKDILKISENDDSNLNINHNETLEKEDKENIQKDKLKIDLDINQKLQEESPDIQIKTDKIKQDNKENIQQDILEKKPQKLELDLNSIFDDSDKISNNLNDNKIINQNSIKTVNLNINRNIKNNYAESLEKLGLDSEEQQEIIEDFIDEVNVNLSLINEFIANKNFEKMYYTTIKIKSSSEILHLDRITKIADNLIAEVKQKRLENITSITLLLKEELNILGKNI